MSLAYIRPINPPGELSLVEIITLSPGDPPPRPHPEPPLGIWGPTDPRPTLPIAGWDPGTGTWPKPPQPPGGGSGGSVAIVKPAPPSDPPATPPEGSPTGTVQMVVWFGPGTIPVKAWIPPYVDASLPV